MPKRVIRKNVEHLNQSALIEWFTLVSAKQFGLPANLLFAVPNGERRLPQTGAKLRDEGVRPGVPDLFLAVARGAYHGLFIEMKAPTGKVSVAQSTMIKLLQEQGYCCYVCYSWLEAKNVIECYLAGGTISI